MFVSDVYGESKTILGNCDAETVSGRQRRFLDEQDRRFYLLDTSGFKVTHCPHGHEYTKSNTCVTKDLNRRCRACVRIGNRKKYLQNPSKWLATARKWRAKNTDKFRQDNRIRVLKRHGMDHESYRKMFSDHNGVCAICKNPPKTGKLLSIDHNHSSGKIRGLLCHNCNVAIGLFYDKTEVMLSAINYLNKKP